MFTLSPRNISLFLLVSIAWYFGAIELYDTITNFSAQWYWFILATVYSSLIVDVFGHLIIGHNQFKINTKAWIYKIFVLLSTTMITIGRLQKFCLNHWLHHAYSDRPHYDSLDVRRMWFTVSSFSPLMYIYSVKVHPLEEKQLISLRKKAKDILNDKWTNFCDQHTVLLTIITWLILYYLFPEFLFKVLFMGRLLISIHGLFSGLGHVKLPTGYKNFNNKDSTYNYLIFHYIGLCIGSSIHLQNNHHNTTGKKTHSCQWYEFDIGSWIVKLLIRPLMSK